MPDDLDYRGPLETVNLPDGGSVFAIVKNMQAIETRFALLAAAIHQSGGDLTFTFEQPVAAATWVVVHNLGKYPAVMVVDSSGRWVLGEVQHDSTNQLTLRFSAPFAGWVYLN